MRMSLPLPQKLGSRIGAVDGPSPDANADRRRELAIVWPLLGQPIAFHRRLVDITQSVKATVMLSQMIYWTRHGRDVVSRGGWFYKTKAQWEWETGLRVREQDTAREILRTLGLVHEHRLGVPAMLHFRVELPTLAGLLGVRNARASAGVDWEDGAALTQLLGPALAYHCRLVAITGGVNAGLLLSRALQLTRGQSAGTPDGWFSRSTRQWTVELGLTRREQDTARRDLARAGIWQEKLTGIPSRLLTRVRLDCLLLLLSGLSVQQRDSIPAAGEEPDSARLILPSPVAQKRRSGLQETRNQDLRKAPTQICAKRLHSTAQSANVHIQGITACLLQPMQSKEKGDDREGLPSGGDLIFPQKLLPEERAAAVALVQRCPKHAQALLDELAARLDQNAVHTSALAYLRGMVRRAMAGEFTPELGARIAAARRERALQEAQRLQRERDAERLAMEQATPGYRERVAKHRVQLRKFLDDLQAAAKSGGVT
jgi:hypothetical protein